MNSDLTLSVMLVPVQVPGQYVIFLSLSAMNDFFSVCSGGMYTCVFSLALHTRRCSNLRKCQYDELCSRSSRDVSAVFFQHASTLSRSILCPDQFS